MYQSNNITNINNVIFNNDVSKQSCLPSRGEQLRHDIQNLASNNKVKSFVKSYGMDIMNVAWEDTGRTKGSCFGPNISDMTLNVNGSNMPIIRKQNFSDITSDQDIMDFNLIVGNESNSEKKMVSLKEYLENIHIYTKNDQLKSMYLERDSKILTSSQACILPLENNEVEFNIKLFNYQSLNEPAVLVIVASSEGTSAQIVTGSESTLYFNKNQQNANFIAERLSDDRKRRGVSLEGPMTNEEKQRNALFVFQIPLKVISRKTSFWDGNEGMIQDNMNENYISYGGYFGGNEGCNIDISNKYGGYFGSNEGCNIDNDIFEPKIKRSINYSKGFENAVIKTSTGFGKFIGTDNKFLERDPKLPIRCTIQYYKVTDTTDISEAMIKEITDQINKQYNLTSLDNKGSLVTGISNRITESSYDTTPFEFGNNKSLMNNL
jgi:hypothetical protein